MRKRIFALVLFLSFSGLSWAQDNASSNFNDSDQIQAAPDRGSWDFTDVDVETEGSLGIEEELIIEVIIFPNPTTGIVNIQAGESIESVSLLSPTGSVLQTWTGIDSADFTLDISDQGMGNYFLAIDFGHTTVVESILKRSSKL